MVVNESKPSHMPFKDSLIELIDNIFFEMTLKLVKVIKVDTNKVYIDGTKIEANANKYTFV